MIFNLTLFSLFRYNPERIWESKEVLLYMKCHGVSMSEFAERHELALGNTYIPKEEGAAALKTEVNPKVLCLYLS